MDYDLIMDDNLSQNESKIKRCVRPTPAEWMQPFRKEYYASTSSTLVRSFNKIYRRTIGSSEFPDGACVWSNILNECDGWHDDGPEFDSNAGHKSKNSLIDAISRVTHCVIYKFHHVFQIVHSHPYIPTCTIIVAILITISVLITNILCNSLAREKIRSNFGSA